MKKVLILTSVFLFTGCSLSKPDYQLIYNTVYSYISRDEKYNLSMVVNHDKILIADSLFAIKSDYLTYPICDQKIFSQRDIDFMIQQNTRNVDFSLQNDSLHKISLFPMDRLRKAPQYKFVYYTISNPLFSKDFKKVLISIDFHCPECGLGKLLILTKDGKDWTIIYDYVKWVS